MKIREITPQDRERQIAAMREIMEKMGVRWDCRTGRLTFAFPHRALPSPAQMPMSETQE